MTQAQNARTLYAHVLINSTFTSHYGQYKTRTADYGLRTGYKIWTRYKTGTGKYGLGIKHGQGIKRGLRTRFKIRTADYFGTETVLIGSR